MRISDWSPDVCSSDLIGLEHGKTEAWYVLSATPDAKIAIGLRRQVTAPQLRASIDDGSISDLVQWHPVSKDDVIFVPAGTIHAVGAGLLLAEGPPRSDPTIRLLATLRQRWLPVNSAL